tara:strand:- start:115 stop:300 length:186 start_codon:yes stop_codon:yes gene_type:complete
MKSKKGNIMNYFLDTIKERIWPSFINRKSKMKWVGFHGSHADKMNPNYKSYTIVKKQKPKS